MVELSHPARPRIIHTRKSAQLDPCLDRFARLFGYLKLNRLTSLLLDDLRPVQNLTVSGNISNQELYQIAGSEFAVNCRVEHRQLADVLCNLQPNPDSPYLFEFELQLLANELSLVPGSFADRKRHDVALFVG